MKAIQHHVDALPDDPVLPQAVPERTASEEVAAGHSVMDWFVGLLGFHRKEKAGNG